MNRWCVGGRLFEGRLSGQMLRRVVQRVASISDTFTAPTKTRTHPLLEGLPPPQGSIKVTSTPGQRSNRANTPAHSTSSRTENGSSPSRDCWDSQSPPADGAHLSCPAGPQLRSSTETAELAARFATETGVSPRHPPPSSATTWPTELLRHWVQAGGRVTVAGLSSLGAEDGVARTPPAHLQPLIDQVGDGYPEIPLARVDVGPTGLLGALRRNDATPLEAVAEALAHDDAAACTLGVSPADMTALRAECDRAWEFMSPGAVQTADGTVIAGKSPSGAARGDRYVLSRELPGGSSEWPTLAAVDAAVGVVMDSLGPQLARHDPELQLRRRSDTFVATFPGDGLGYNAHFDGDDRCRITCILYTSDWSSDDGGRLQLLNEDRECWMVVPPVADTLVLFRSDRVLHKVEGCAAQRHALTVFASLGRSEAEVARERAALASVVGAYT